MQNKKGYAEYFAERGRAIAPLNGGADFKVCTQKWKDVVGGVADFITPSWVQSDKGYCFIPRTDFVVLDVDEFLDGTREELASKLDDIEIPYVLTRKGIHIYGRSSLIKNKGRDGAVWSVCGMRLTGEWRANGMGYVVGAGSTWYEYDTEGKVTASGLYTGSVVFDEIVSSGQDFYEFGVGFLEELLDNLTVVSAESDSDYGYNKLVYAPIPIAKEGFIGAVLSGMLAQKPIEYTSYKSIDQTLFSNVKNVSIRDFMFIGDKKLAGTGVYVGNRHNTLLDVVSIWIHYLMGIDTDPAMIGGYVMKSMVDLWGSDNFDRTGFNVSEAKRIAFDKLRDYAGIIDLYGRREALRDVDTLREYVSAVPVGSYEHAYATKMLESTERNIIVSNEPSAIAVDLGGVDDLSDDTYMDSVILIDNTVKWSASFGSYGVYLRKKMPYVRYESGTHTWRSYQKNSGHWLCFKGDEPVEQIVKKLLISDNLVTLEIRNSRGKWKKDFEEFKLDVSTPFPLRSGERWSEGGVMFNKMKLLFLCKEGVVDLSRDGLGHVLPHSPAYEYIAPSYLSLERQSDNLPADWHAIINRLVSSDSEKYSWMQMVFGYCLTGSTKINKMFMLYSMEGTGKSTVVSAVLNMMGSFGISKQIDQFGTDKFSLDDMRDVRMVYSDEVGEGRVKTEFLKGLITGTRAKAEDKGIKGVPFIPTAKIILTCNKMPSFTEIDGGMIDRIAICTFHSKIRNTGEQNMDLPEILSRPCMQTEIFWWCVEGLRLLHATEFRIPILSEQIEILNELQINSDSVLSFLNCAEFIELNPLGKNDMSFDHGTKNSANGYFETLKDSYNCYEAYCVDNRTDSRYRLRKNAFAKRLQKLGYILYEIEQKTKTGYFGFKIKRNNNGFIDPK